MIKRSFFGFTTPRIQYLPIPGNVTAPAVSKQPESVTLLVPCPAGEVDDQLAKKGDHVKTGQKISLASAPGAYGIASLTGTLSSIDRFPGEAGREYTAVTITASGAETLDDAFESQCEPTLENAAAFLSLPARGAFIRSVHGSGKTHPHHHYQRYGCGSSGHVRAIHPGIPPGRDTGRHKNPEINHRRRKYRSGHSPGRFAGLR